MSNFEANIILDKLRDGAFYPPHIVTMALFLVGDVNETELEKMGVRFTNE